MNSPEIIQASGRKEKLSNDSVRMQYKPLEIPLLDPERGILPVKAYEKDIEIRIPRFDNVRPRDVITLVRNGVDFGGTIPAAGLTEPYYTHSIKAEHFPALGSDETWSLDYKVYDPRSADGSPTGLTVRARFDRLAPGGLTPPPIAFTQDQLEGITEDDMSGDRLEVMINPYYDGEPDDVIQMWLSTTSAEDEQFYLTPSFTVLDPLNPMSVHFTRDQLMALDVSGTLYFGYRVTDWAGNVSRRSTPVGIRVFLDQPELLAPAVPEAGDGLVTFNDAVPDVQVDIPAYEGAAEGDRIVLFWKNAAMSYELKAADLPKDPLVSLLVPYTTVSAQSGVVEETVPVRYEMIRGTQPVVSSPVTAVRVNLETPGGVDPDPLTPIHENLQPPLINPSNTPPNTVTAQQFDNALAPHVELARSGQSGAEPVWKVGDVIQLHWANLHAPQIASIEVDESNEGQNIRFDVPFDTVVKVVGTGQISVFYSITRQLPVEGSEPVAVMVRSPEQIVSVASSAILPGNGTLDPGSFPEAIDIFDIPTIQRPVGLDGTPFRIPLADVSNITPDLEPVLTYEFMGYMSEEDGVPIDEPWEPIEQSRVSGTVSLSEADIERGYYEVHLDYADVLAVICDNGALLNYSLSNINGLVNAPRHYVYIAVNEVSGFCPVPFLNQ